VGEERGRCCEEGRTGEGAEENGKAARTDGSCGSDISFKCFKNKPMQKKREQREGTEEVAQGR
jgi:hypothetical protein